MNNGGDAAEQVVRLSLEGFEVAARLSGSAAKNIALLLVSVLKQEQKTKGKARLTNMIKSGKELKVFSIPQKDLKKFTEQAKRYGVLYCVLRDKNTKGENAPVDIIARAEDASKIQRIVERWIRLLLSVKQRKLSQTVKRLKKKSRLNPRVKSLWKKRSEIQCRKRSEQTQTPQSPKQTKALCQGKTQSR